MIANDLIPSREKSVRAPGRERQYVVKALERGPGNDDVSGFPAGRCTMVIRAPCSQGCPEGESDFGAGCAAATPMADVCPEGEADFGDGCVVACPAGQVVSASGDTCVAQKCCSSDIQCAAGSICPGRTVVSAECTDRSLFNESPFACTALQQLAALSPRLPTTAPWDDLANAAYCQTGSLYVGCAPVGGVQLPTNVEWDNAGLAGALPPSLGDLGSLLPYLYLTENAITSVPTELGALTGLVDLYLHNNAITSVPIGFQGFRVLGV